MVAGGTKSTDTNTIVPDATSITHNGTTYGFVTSPHTGKVWLDKNLGAAEICAGLDDAQCYGDYYQWGRGHDGHQESNSDTTSAQVTDINDVGDGKFITDDGVNNYDWTFVDVSGITRQVNWSKTDGTSVCPVGFRVPTKVELENETILASDVTGSTRVINNGTAFSNFLKLPSAGYRNNSDGLVHDVVQWGYVWTSSAAGFDSRSLDLSFNSVNARIGDSGRANGYSVRCLRN